VTAPTSDDRRIAAGDGVEQDLGYHQLRMRESGFLQKMGRDRQRPHRNEGAIPGPAQPTNQVFARTSKSVSLPSSVARLRGASQRTLPNVPGLLRART